MPLGLALVGSAGGLIEQTSLPPSALLSGMQKHIVEDDGPMGTFYLPSGVFVQEQFGIKPLFFLLIDSLTSLAPSLVDWDLCSLSP